MFCVCLDQIPKTLKHIGGEVCLHSKLTSHIFRCQLGVRETVWGVPGGNDRHVSFSTHCHSVSLNLLCSFSNEQLFFFRIFFFFAPASAILQSNLGFLLLLLLAGRWFDCLRDCFSKLETIQTDRPILQDQREREKFCILIWTRRCFGGTLVLEDQIKWRWGGGPQSLLWSSQRLKNKTCGMINSITCVFVTRRAKQRSERRRNQTLRQTLRLKGSTPIASGRRLKCHWGH